MGITPTDFKTRFVEFVAVDDSRIQIFIDESVTVLNETYWDTKYDLGLLYYTAHLLYLDEKNATSKGPAGVSGPIAGRTVDGTSVTYNTAGTTPSSLSMDAFLLTTNYGQNYLRLRSTLGIAAMSLV